MSATINNFDVTFSISAPPLQPGAGDLIAAFTLGFDLSNQDQLVATKVTVGAPVSKTFFFAGPISPDRPHGTQDLGAAHFFRFNGPVKATAEVITRKSTTPAQLALAEKEIQVDAPA